MIWTVALWAASTVLHFVLTARAVGRVLPRDTVTLDERIFAAVLGGVTSLLIVMHAIAVSVGLSLGAGIIGLAVWHAALAWATRVQTARTENATPSASSMSSATTLELLALAMGLGILLTWIGVAAQSADVLGADAAHYHVPYAVNLAAGASPFDLPATPHLYPMAGSMAAAWFIVPLGHPLIADLAMALPFVLLAASINVLFRSATGLSGTAWASWLTLAVFSTPMFRSSSLGAADLWFAAAFVSFLAAIALPWSRRNWTGLDLVLTGGALGVLIGSKATGAPAAVLIASAAGAVSLARRMFGGSRVAGPSARVLPIVAACAAVVGAGGVWLIRSWLQFGSPVAPAGLTIAGVSIFDGEPFQRSKYLSVLAELDTDSFHLWDRTRHFVAQWFGSWFLPALIPVALLAADLVAGARKHARQDQWWPRASLLAITAGAGIVLIWMLMGAPWTGLERSRGFTLRYALPIAALLPLLAFIGCFPLTVPWYRHTGLRRLAATVAVAGSTALFLTAGRATPVPAPVALTVPPLEWQWLAGSLVAVWLLDRASRNAGVVRGIAATGLVAIVAWSAPMIARRDANVRAGGSAAFELEEAAFGAGSTPANPWRAAFLAVRAAERADKRHCEAERFYSLVRFDEPLALQPPGFGNQVFYAGRDVDAARRAGPIAPCDFIISSAAVAATTKGQALARALAGVRELRPFASTANFVILAVPPSERRAVVVE